MTCLLSPLIGRIIIVWATLRVFVAIVLSRRMVTLVLMRLATRGVRAALSMLVQSFLVQLLNPLNFFLGYLCFAKWTASVDHQPLLYAISVVVVPYITWQRSHEICLFEWNEADHTALLVLENIRVVFGFEQGVDHDLSRLTS